MEQRKENERLHGVRLSQGCTEDLWGWGSPAGQMRARRRAELILAGADVSPGMRVLEIGCGTGMFTEMFSSLRIQLDAVDISPDLLARARQRELPENRVTFTEADVETVEFPYQFDAIIGSSILHHLDVEKTFSQIRRLLKPGRRFCFAEPNKLNPQVWVMFTFRRYFPYVSPDENPFLKHRLIRFLLKCDVRKISVQPFDWLHPSTPRKWIGPVSKIGRSLERLPLFREFAGSLLISGEFPES